MHFNGPQTKFIRDSLYKHPVFYQNWGKFHTAAKLLIHNGRQSCEANSPDSFMGDNKEMILTNFLGSIKLELSEVVLGPDFRQGSVADGDIIIDF